MDLSFSFTGTSDLSPFQAKLDGVKTISVAINRLFIITGYQLRRAGANLNLGLHVAQSSAIMGFLHLRAFMTENITYFRQSLYALLMLFSVASIGEVKGVTPHDLATNCHGQLSAQPTHAYIVLAPVEPGEIVRIHQSYSTGELLEYKIFGNVGDHVEGESAPGYLQDFALLLESRYPQVAELIRARATRAEIDFMISEMSK